MAVDSIDNIPGVPGIWEKTALKLISRFRTVDNLLSHLEEIKEKGIRTKLEENAEQARLSHRLVVLEEEVPLQVDLENLRPGPPDPDALRPLFQELEFSKFTQELGFNNAPAGDFQLVQDQPALDQVAAALKDAQEAGVFFLLGEQHPVMARVAGVAFSWQPGEGAYLPLDGELAPDLIWQALAPLFQDPGILKMSSDLKAALQVCSRFGLELAGARGDILLASYLLNPARYDQTLENVARHYLALNLPGPRELAGRPTALLDLSPEQTVQYACQRAAAILAVWPQLEAELDQEGLKPLYQELELPLLAVLARMETRGIGVDRDFLTRFGQELESEMQRLD